MIARKPEIIQNRPNNQCSIWTHSVVGLALNDLQTSLRALPPGFGSEFEGGPKPKEVLEADVRDVARSYSSQLRERSAVELPLLPFDR